MSREVERMVRRHLRARGQVAARDREAPEHLAAYGFAPDVVADVGVAEGTPSLYAAWPDALFVLIDPRAEVEEELKDRPAKAAFHACAVGREDGVLDLRIPVTKGGRTGAMAGFREIAGPMGRNVVDIETRRVPVRRLDDVLRDHPGRVGLKVDTEGFELEVLEGAPETLDRTDFAILELSLTPRFEGLAPPSRVIALLARHGLELRDILSLPGDGRGGPQPRYADALFTRWAA